MHDKQFLLPQKLNVDKDYRALDPMECTYKLNLRTGLTAGGNAPSSENFLGNTEIVNPYRDDADIIIGSAPDISNDSIIYMVYNPDATKHKIIRYFPYNNDLVELILQHEYLNFQLTHKITSINVIDGLLYWTDGYEGEPFVDYNPPRKINILRAIGYSNPYDNWVTYSKGMHVGWFGKCYEYISDTPSLLHPSTSSWVEVENKVYFAITKQVLDRIKYPPQYAPRPSYVNDDQHASNQLRNKLFQFSYRYTYDDNEKSVWSQTSIVPIPSTVELPNGSFVQNNKIDNRINVWYNTGTRQVVSIEIAVREGNHGAWVVVEKIDKYDIDGSEIIQSDIDAVYLFYNNDVGGGLDQADKNRPYDAVPQISYHEELIEKNRISDEDYVEGFDPVDLSVALTSTQTVTVPGKVGGAIGTESYDKRKFIALAFIGLGDIEFKYYGGLINLIHPYPGAPFWENGFTYIINISAAPGRYNNPEGIETASGFLQMTYGDYYEKVISSSAVVTATMGMTFGDFCDAVVLQLRVGSSMGKVIGLNNYNYKSFSIYHTMYDEYNGSGSPVVPDGHLGFIIEFAGSVSNDWGDCVNCAYVDVDILKIHDNIVVDTFKSGTFHNFGIVYKDIAGRRSSVNTNSDCKIYIPSQIEQTPPHEIYQNKIQWAVSNTPPMFADYFQWVYSKNTTITYSLYASISAVSNVPKTLNIAASNSTSICVNEYIVETSEILTKLIVEPYVWQSGDRVRFVFQRQPDNKYLTLPSELDFEILGVYYQDGDTGYQMDTSTTPLPILDSNGNKVRSISGSTFVIEKINFQKYGITANDTVVEIYRPRKESEEIVYYDFGQPIPIINPHTDNRFHSGDTTNQNAVTPATGEFDFGDSYIGFRTIRNGFPCERFNFSDFYPSETISIGFPNVVDRNMRRQRFVSNIRYSGLYLENTQVNDLSRCLGADYDQLPQKFGNINAAKEVGDVLRVIQTEKCTSIYIGKVGFKQTPGSPDVVSVSEGVIGTKYFHPETYGTVFPESVVTSVNFTYFFDIYNSAMCRWANNGVNQIVGKESSTGWDFGMKTYFTAKSKALLASGIENVNVYCTYEKEFENLIVTFVDHINSDNSETIMFHEPTNSWITFASFIPDNYGTIGLVLTSSLNGYLYRHNTNSLRNNFYGVQYGQILEIVSHGKNQTVIFDGLEIKTNSNNWSAPNTGDVSVKVDNTLMQSRIKQCNFVDREGVKIATFGKDMMTSGTERLFDLLNGQDLRGDAIKVRLQNPDTTEVVVFGITVNFQISE